MNRSFFVAIIVFTWFALAGFWMSARGEDLNTFLNAQLSLPMWLVLLKLLVVFLLISRRLFNARTRTGAVETAAR